LEHHGIYLFPDPFLPPSGLPQFRFRRIFPKKLRYRRLGKRNHSSDIDSPHGQILLKQTFQKTAVIFERFRSFPGKVEKEIQPRKNFGKSPWAVPPPSGFINDSDCLKGLFEGNLEVIERAHVRVEVFHAQRETVSLGISGCNNFNGFSGFLGKPGNRQGIAVVRVKNFQVWAGSVNSIIEFFQICRIRAYASRLCIASIRKDVGALAKPESSDTTIPESTNLLKYIFCGAFSVGRSLPLRTKTAMFSFPATSFRKLKFRYNSRIGWML
jgi:hypothetical protein